MNPIPDQIKRIFNYLSLHLLRRVEIRYRLIGSFILLTLLPLLISGYISYVNSSKAIEEKTRVLATELVSQVSSNVQLRIAQIDAESESLVLSGQVQHALNEIADGNSRSQNAARQGLTQILLDHYGSFDFINQKYFLDKDGKIVDTQAFAQLTQGVMRFVVRAPKPHGKPHWGSYENGAGQQNLGMLRTIVSKSSNKPVGNLLLVIRPEHFSAIFDDVDLGNGSDIFILDSSSDKVIVWPRSKPSGDDDSIAPALAENIARSLQNNEQRSFVAFDDKQKHEYFAAYSHVPGTTWFVVSTVPKDQLNAEAHSIRNKIVLIGALCFLLAIFLAYFISYSISVPLSELVRKMRGTGNDVSPPHSHNDLFHLLQTAGQDELSRLSQHFEWMNSSISQKIRQINEINASLEQTIAARTAELAASEQEVRTLIENSPDTIARYDSDCRRRYVNPAFGASAGGAGALVGKRPSEFPGGANSDLYEEKIREVFNTGQSTWFELTWPGIDGKVTCSHIRLTPERDATGTINTVLAIGRDITELNEARNGLKQANQQLETINHELGSAQTRLRINEARLQTILDNSPLGIWLVDVDGRYHFVNKTFCNATGIPESKFIAAQHLSEVMDPTAAANCIRSDRECLAQEEPHLSHETLTFVDGKQHILEITKIKVHDSTGAIIGLIGTAIDITEQCEREAELANSRERLREIEHRQMLAQERQRLMQDMHDGLGSSLTSALRVVEHGQIGEEEVATLLKGCIDDLKLAIDSMEPVDADLLLLLATLRFRLGPRLESTGIALKWEVQNVPDLDWLDPKNALHILRILQEAFTNIIKHTQATEIRVATGVDGDLVVVTIADNGLGFDVESALKSGGKGLSNQLRRAEAIGAKISWQSDAHGTCFILRLPIKRQQ